VADIPDLSPQGAFYSFLGVLGTGLGVVLRWIIKRSLQRLKEADKNVPWTPSDPAPAKPVVTAHDFSGQMMQRIHELERALDERTAQLGRAEVERHKHEWLAAERVEEAAELRESQRALVAERDSLRALLRAAQAENVTLYEQIEAMNRAGGSYGTGADRSKHRASGEGGRGPGARGHADAGAQGAGLRRKKLGTEDQ
jgi:hypothetical protein